MARPWIPLSLIAAAALASAPAAADCVSPWKTFFSCNIAKSDARAEFCKLDDPDAYPALKEGYYTYTRSTGPADLRFETDNIKESFKENAFNPTQAVAAFGYVRGTYVYAFFATEDRKGGFPHAEIRVYNTVEKFMDKARRNESERLVCDPDSIRTIGSFLE
jgi:hypothetical protein